MNQAAKDAVELIDEYKKELGPDGGPQYPVTMSVSEARKIIAGLELLRGVAEGKEEIVPAEPGIGFWNALQRGMEATWENEGPDQITDVFREWNEERRAMITENDHE